MEYKSVKSINTDARHLQHSSKAWRYLTPSASVKLGLLYAESSSFKRVLGFQTEGGRWRAASILDSRNVLAQPTVIYTDAAGRGGPPLLIKRNSQEKHVLPQRHTQRSLAPTTRQKPWQYTRSDVPMTVILQQQRRISKPHYYGARGAENALARRKTSSARVFAVCICPREAEARSRCFKK